MHFGDEKHLQNAYLELIVYKHVVSHDCLEIIRGKSYDYQLCSIYDCKYISINDIHKLYEDFEDGDCVEDKYKTCKKLKEETFYKVRFQYDKKCHLKVAGFMEITHDMFNEDPFLGLH